MVFFLLLIRIKEKYPQAFDDICLYSEVSYLLAHCTFRLPSRRFIQELFQDVQFLQVSGGCSWLTGTKMCHLGASFIMLNYKCFQVFLLKTIIFWCHSCKMSNDINTSPDFFQMHEEAEAILAASTKQPVTDVSAESWPLSHTVHYIQTSWNSQTSSNWLDNKVWSIIFYTVPEDTGTWRMNWKTFSSSTNYCPSLWSPLGIY